MLGVMGVGSLFLLYRPNLSSKTYVLKNDLGKLLSIYSMTSHHGRALSQSVSRLFCLLLLLLSSAAVSCQQERATGNRDSSKLKVRLFVFWIPVSCWRDTLDPNKRLIAQCVFSRGRIRAMHAVRPDENK